MTGKKSTLTVFVMRHGERLDEALKRQGKPVPHDLKMDPPLTATGHHEAQQAFTRLAQGLAHDGRQRKVALFSSPTKRTIGTSLMVSTSGFKELEEQKQIEWGLNLSNAQEKGEETSIIPITVLNGLGSCAARIARFGGAEAVAHMGLLPCADVEANQGRPIDPIVEELGNMQQLVNHARNDEHANLVRYQKIQRENILPMTPPVTPYSTLPMPPAPSCGYRTVAHYCQQTGPECFWQALDRAVLLAESKGCDTLIVVSHREGVREMLQRWGHNGYDKQVRLNYCCIASFIVQVYHHDQSCRWCFHGVKDYQDFDVNSVPSKERWNQRQEVVAQNDNQHSTITTQQTRNDPKETIMIKKSDAIGGTSIE